MSKRDETITALKAVDLESCQTRHHARFRCIDAIRVLPLGTFADEVAAEWSLVEQIRDLERRGLLTSAQADTALRAVAKESKPADVVRAQLLDELRMLVLPLTVDIQAYDWRGKPVREMSNAEIAAAVDHLRITYGGKP